MSGSRVKTGLALVASVLCALALPAAAQAAFPGANGKIAFERGHDIWSMNPDGTGQVNLTNTGAFETDPAWSPDGTKVAFSSHRDPSEEDCGGGVPCNTEIYVMNADGTNQTRLTNTIGLAEYWPAWSPDGTKLAFGVFDGCSTEPDCINGIATMNSDGSGREDFIAPLHPGPGRTDPAYSPDGTRIAYTEDIFTSSTQSDRIFIANTDGSNSALFRDDYADYADWSPDGSAILFDVAGPAIAKQNVDGTGFTTLTGSGSTLGAWSPDGTRIAFTKPAVSAPRDVWTMNADGTNQARLAIDGADPSWQPVSDDYIRPKAAAPIRVSLAPAYRQCNPALANRTHGPPLAFPACNPPSRASSHLTVGTPDANGASAKASAFVRYGVRIGNPATAADEADVRIIASLTDVRNDLTLVDYAGELQLDQSLRITDRDNAPTAGSPGPGTVIDTNFPVTIPCVPTADTSVGSTCAIDTTVEAMVPNAVKEGRRSVWEVGQVKVYDGGSDGVATTLGDNTLFMDEGLFVP
jgi:dipeptidyl aminopeptidase/acylaminoacyl peptidase